MFQRQLLNEITQLAKQFRVISITGPRQSGKTTIVKKACPDKPYVNLEDPVQRDFAQTDPRGFLANYPEGAIIDEAQYVPDLFSYIQLIVDENDTPGLFILTGSQNFLLLEKISQSLAGRVVVLHLLPLSFNELGDQLPPTYETIIYQGGFPEVHQKQLDPNIWYRNYINTYLERDVRQIKNIDNLALFQKFLQLCAGRCGQLLNLSSLSNDCGISQNTVKSWINILEASFICFRLQPYHVNFNKRVIKTPKLYFYDTGMVCALLGLNEDQAVSNHYMRGELFENLIISELTKFYYHQGKEPRMYFWRDKTGHEVDCIIEHNGELRAIEIKSAKTINQDHLIGLTYWQELSGSEPKLNYVIYGGSQNQQRSKANILSWHDLRDIFK